MSHYPWDRLAVVEEERAKRGEGLALGVGGLNYWLNDSGEPIPDRLREFLVGLRNDLQQALEFRAPGSGS